MGILIIDDDKDVSKMLGVRLESAGYQVAAAASVTEGMEYLKQGEHSNGNGHQRASVELVLMDVFMPEVSGIEACREIKSSPELCDIPVIMLTASTDMNDLDEAFDAGATDFVSKPYNKIELLARIRSALRLKREMDWHKKNEQALRIANSRLKKLSAIDGLTGLYNRRYFDEALEKEHLRAVRHQHSLSLIMIDIDRFKEYNDVFGHQAGDECLRLVSRELQRVVHRSHDLVGRYGGEEFAVILPETDEIAAASLAEALQVQIMNLKIRHPVSTGHEVVTISLGVASMIPSRDSDSDELVALADQALYQSKADGRNRVTVFESEPSRKN